MKLKHLFIFVAAGTLVAGCGELDEEFSADLSDNTLNNIQTKGDRFASRFDNTTGEWEANDAIGVFMQTAAEDVTVENGWNVRFATTEGGVTAQFVTGGMGIPLPEENVDVFAYYPYEDAVYQDYLYHVEIGSQEDGISQYDLMYAKVENQSPATLASSGLNLQFAHKMSLVKVNVTLPENLNGQKVESVILNGLNTVGDFNLQTGEWEEVTSPTVTNVALNETGDNAFQGIVLPAASLDNLTLTFMLTDNSTYRFEMSEVDGASVTAFQEGYEYTFTIDLNAPVNGYLDEIAGSTSTPWGEGGTVSGDAGQIVSDPDIPADYNLIEVSSSEDFSKLATVGGKVALRFNADVASGVEQITIPEKVTELVVKGANDGTQLSVRSFIVEGSLSKLSLLNMDITGNTNNDLFCNTFSEGAEVIVRNCKLSDMRFVFNVPSGDVNSWKSLTIKDCQIQNARSVVNQYAIQTVTLTESTLWNFSDKAFNLNSSLAVPTLNVSYCTIVDMDKTPFECVNGSNGRLNYEYNISAVFMAESDNANLAYKMEAGTFAGNYAAASGDEALFPAVKVHKNDVAGGWTNTEMTVEQLFTDAAAGDFSTAITDAGDPRWRNNQ